jgi:hypothetical protein
MASAEYGWTPDYILDFLTPAMLNLYMAAAAKHLESYYSGRSSNSSSGKADVIQITEANDALLADFGIKKAVKHGRSK